VWHLHWSSVIIPFLSVIHSIPCSFLYPYPYPYSYSFVWDWNLPYLVARPCSHYPYGNRGCQLPQLNRAGIHSNSIHILSYSCFLSLSPFLFLSHLDCKVEKYILCVIAWLFFYFSFFYFSFLYFSTGWSFSQLSHYANVYSFPTPSLSLNHKIFWSLHDIQIDKAFICLCTFTYKKEEHSISHVCLNVLDY